MKSILSLSFLLILSGAQAQTAYAQGSVVPDFPMNTVLNYTAPATTFNKLKKDLTIIDFFGTWCVPCIKALPHLKALQEQYRERLQVVLVSVEEEGKLKSFITKQGGLAFPLVVDKSELITGLFAPPSYPYSVVLDRNGLVLAVLTDAGGLNEASIQSWLSKEVATPPINTDLSKLQKPTIVAAPFSKSTNALVLLSQNFIYAAKTGDSLISLEAQLAALDATALEQQLKTDAEKTAFWINIYNGFTNAILKRAPEKYKNRGRFFKAKQVPIAGRLFSLDEIEHDILRRSKIKWSLGYLGKIFPSRIARKLQVDSLDYRIHFALNCGARSCPPIAYYSPEALGTQLEVATKAYLGGEVSYDQASGLAQLPALMGWFRADFGGKKGMIAIMKKHGIIPQEAQPRVRFKKYDWTLELNNYKTQ